MITMLMALACGDKDPGDSGATDSGATTDDSSEPEAFAPTWGDWQTEDGEITDDTCGFPDDDEDSAAPAGSTITLTDGGDGAFTITVDADGTIVTFNCTLADQDWSCDSQVVLEQDFSEIEVDALLTGTSSPSGSFSDENNLSGTQVVAVECAGEGCTDVEAFIEGTFPCGFTLPFTATAASGG